MKVNQYKTIEVNNQLKVNVDEQQDGIKYLKEQCNKDAGTPMKKKNKSVCVTCNKKLQNKIG